MILSGWTKEITRVECRPETQTVNCIARLNENIGEAIPYLVQTSEFVFEVRAELLNHENPDQVFEQIIQSISEVFSKNGLIDVKVGKSDTPPHLTASGKFHEVIPLTLHV